MPSLYLSSVAELAGQVRPAGGGLPSKITVKVGEETRDVPVTYFWKDAIAVGEYVHPATKQKLSVDAARLDRLVDKFHQMRKAGIEIPTPTDHSTNARDNIGFVVDAKRNGDRLSLLHQVIGEDAVDVALRNRCSLCIDPDYVDEKGTKWGDAIVHSAYTPTPVITGMGSFVPFAASRDANQQTPVYYLCKDESKGNKMDPKRLRELFNIPADVADDKIDEWLAGFHKAKVDADAKVATLSRTANPPAVDPEAMRDRADLTTGRIDLSVARGDMPPAIATKLKEKLGKINAGESGAFLLSRNDAIGGRPVDFVLSLFDGAKLNPETGDKSGVQLLGRTVPGGDQTTQQTAEEKAALEDADAGVAALLRSRGIAVEPAAKK